MIEYLPLTFPSDNFIEIETLFKICQRLKVLSIFMFHLAGHEHCEEVKLDYGDKFARALIEFAPRTLELIKVTQYSWKFSLKALETLMESWKGRPALTIIGSDPDYENQGYINIINKYKRDGVLKDFKYDADGDNYLFKDEMLI